MMIIFLFTMLAGAVLFWCEVISAEPGDASPLEGEVHLTAGCVHGRRLPVAEFFGSVLPLLLLAVGLPLSMVSGAAGGVFVVVSASLYLVPRHVLRLARR